MHFDPGQPVLLFDGECGLCSRTVRFILRNEQTPALMFAPQQTAAGKALMAENNISGLAQGTVILLWNGKIYLRSDAALNVLVLMGGVWKAAGKLGLLFPRPVRDGVYKLIAKNRNRIMGKDDACPLYTASQKARFLDGTP